MNNSKKSKGAPIGSARLGRYNYHQDDRFFTDFKVRDSVKNAKK